MKSRSMLLAASAVVSLGAFAAPAAARAETACADLA